MDGWVPSLPTPWVHPRTPPPSWVCRTHRYYPGMPDSLLLPGLRAPPGLGGGHTPGGDGYTPPGCRIHRQGAINTARVPYIHRQGAIPGCPRDVHGVSTECPEVPTDRGGKDLEKVTHREEYLHTARIILTPRVAF